MGIKNKNFIICSIFLALNIISNNVLAFHLDSSFVETIKNIKFKMIKIPNRDYFVAESEVTQELWEAITGETPSQYQRCSKCPVESVSYNDITQKFLPKLNELTRKKYRLPSYKEWFFASLGGERYKEGAKDNINEISWNYENSKLTPQVVMQKKPNGYGLYDMIGNVYEWTNTTTEGHEKRIVYYTMGGDWGGHGWRLHEKWFWTMHTDDEDEGTGLRLFLTLEP